MKNFKNNPGAFIFAGFMTFLVVWSVLRWPFVLFEANGFVNVMDWIAYFPIRLPWEMLKFGETFLTLDESNLLGNLLLGLIALVFLVFVLSLMWGGVKWIFGLFIPHYLLGTNTERVRKANPVTRKHFSLF